jgi:DNA-binding transcriptional LysR family regulator
VKLEHLRHVVAVAERGSLRAAARHLGVAQPALTRSIHDLERELRVELFERQARGMAPTAMGHLFLRRAGAIVSEVRRAREELEQTQGGTGGTVAACLSSAGHIALLPHALRPFRLRYPAARLRIIEGLYPTIEASLRDGSVDFYVGPAPESPVPPDLKLETLFANTRVVIARKDHPLAGATALRQLVDAEWIASSVTYRAEEEFRELFERHRLPAPRLLVQSQSGLSLIVAVANSDLLAMVPVQWTGFAVTQGILQPIGIAERLPAAPIVLVRRAGLPLTPAAEFMTDLLRRAAAYATGDGSPTRATPRRATATPRARRSAGSPSS